MSVFIAFVLGVGWILGALYMGDGYSGLVLAGGVSLLMTMVSYYQGDTIALWSAGAQQIKRDDNPYLWNMVENASITVGLPMPKVYIIPESGLNAFATGRNPEHASVAFTAGIIEQLENEELEGVVAHELSHIKNYDTRLMMIVAVLVGMIALLADGFWHARWLGRSNNERNNQTQLVFMIIGIVLVIVSPLIAQLIKLAVSRRREYLADASAVLTTRYADGLIGALQKIETNGSGLSHANQATAHLYLASPFSNKRRWAASLFSTHPPIADRITALEGMKGQIS